MDDARTVETRVSTIEFGDDGIIRVVCNENVDFSEADARETLSQIDELTGHQPAPHCVDMRRIRSMDRRARTTFANAENTQAAALVVDNPLSRVIGNFFLGLSKTRFPLRLFNSPESAVEWLRSN